MFWKEKKSEERHRQRNQQFRNELKISGMPTEERRKRKNSGEEGEEEQEEGNRYAPRDPQRKERANDIEVSVDSCSCRRRLGNNDDVSRWQLLIHFETNINRKRKRKMSCNITRQPYLCKRDAPVRCIGYERNTPDGQETSRSFDIVVDSRMIGWFEYSSRRRRKKSREWEEQIDYCMAMMFSFSFVSDHYREKKRSEKSLKVMCLKRPYQRSDSKTEKYLNQLTQ